MLLAFDTGNTNVMMGLYDGERLFASWRFATDAQRTADEYAVLCQNFFKTRELRFDDVDQIIISSVVPDLTRTLVRMCEEYFEISPLLVEVGVKTGLKLRYENPKELGADRIVNAVSGIERYGAPLIIVDFGTATTFCAINDKREYLGGAITAGIGISMEALFSHAAKLPKVELIAPTAAIGRTTTSAMQSGLLFGYADMVDGMITRLARELEKSPDEVFVVATGGLAGVVCANCQHVDKVDPMLTLEGLRLIAERNKGGLRHA
ncbi:MAG: type III pantothenate kinase [Peptococcaceae bacterium]|nr:type III pantothenate kinase [Peptococcaceae bacterium]